MQMLNIVLPLLVIASLEPPAFTTWIRGKSFKPINLGFGKLPTYPSPKLTWALTSHLVQNDGLGEG